MDQTLGAAVGGERRADHRQIQERPREFDRGGRDAGAALELDLGPLGFGAEDFNHTVVRERVFLLAWNRDIVDSV